MRRPLVLVLTLVALVALVAVGCGGGSDDGGGGGAGKPVSKDAYGKQLAQAGQALQKTFADISDQTGANTSTKEVGDHLDEGAKALDGAVVKFKAITPPPSAKAAHAKLVQGLGELADVFRRGAAAARKNDTKTLTAALASLRSSDGVKKITEAQQELKAQGVTVTTASK
jgi:hypothetical protein